MKRYIKSNSYLADYEKLKTVLNAMQHLFDEIEDLSEDAYSKFESCVDDDFYTNLSDGIMFLSNEINNTGSDK